MSDVTQASRALHLVYKPGAFVLAQGRESATAVIVLFFFRYENVLV